MRAALMLVIVVASACSRSPSSCPATAPDADPAATAPAPASGANADATAASPSITDRVWMRAGAIAAPGSLQIFLADGTLVSDSCWETYRLSKWRRESDDRIAWQEDGIDVGATLVRVTGDELVLRLDPPADSDEQRFTAAKVPYVCPDMPRG